MSTTHSTHYTTKQGHKVEEESPPMERSHRSISPITFTRQPKERGDKGKMREGHGAGVNRRHHESPRRPLTRPHHPAKWTKYDLSDDGTKELKKRGMSAEQINKFAAFQFLKELKNRKGEAAEGDCNEGEEAIRGQKIIFKKPPGRDGTQEQKVLTSGSGAEKVSGKDTAGDFEDGGRRGGVGAGVILMPEYVVGGKKKGGEGKWKRKKLQVVGRVEGNSGNGSGGEEEEGEEQGEGRRKRKKIAERPGRKEEGKERKMVDSEEGGQQREGQRRTADNRTKPTGACISLSHLEEDED